MKKFFAVLLMAATILSVAQIVEPVTAYAKDVWVASDERCQYYVMTETFKYRYADTKGFSVVVKTLWQDGSGSVDSLRWDFFFDDAQNGCWMCSNETTGRPFPVRNYPFTQKILNYCLENLY